MSLPAFGVVNDFVVVRSLSHIQLFVTPMNCGTPGFPVLQYIPEFAQTPVHWVSDAIQLSHSLPPPSLLAFSLSQNQSFPVSQLFASDSQSIGASASASVLPMNIQGWFPLGLIGLISLQSKGLPRIFSSTILQKHQFFGHSAFFMVQLSHPYMTTGKTITLTIQTFVDKVISLFFNTLSRFVIAFLTRSKRLHFMAVATVSSDFGAQENKACHCFHYLFAMRWWDRMPWS